MTAGRKVISDNKEWNTPEKIVNILHEFWGEIALDPCSNSGSIINAKENWKDYCPPANECQIVDWIVYGREGLRQEWNYPTIFVNPPYGRKDSDGTTIKDWIRKCHDAYYQFDAEVIALIPVATNTSHWKEFIWNKDGRGANAICFLFDTRLKFRINGSEDNKGCPMSCCLVYWGERWKRFRNCFEKLGAMVRIE